MEIITVGKKIVILDGAHNPHGMKAVKEALFQFDMVDVVGVIGMLQDKNCETAMNIITPYLSRLIPTMSDSPRSLDDALIAEMAHHSSRYVIPIKDYRQAFAVALSAPENIVLVTGSLYLVSNIKRTILEEYNEKK